MILVNGRWYLGSWKDLWRPNIHKIADPEPMNSTGWRTVRQMSSRDGGPVR